MKLVDKTFIFKGLEAELLSSRSSSGSLQANLDEAFEDLRGYFDNPKMLMSALRVGALTFEHAFLRASIEHHHVSAFVNSILKEFRQARDLDQEGFYDFWVERMHLGGRAINNAAGVATLQGDKENLDPHLLVKSYFRDIGDLLEGSLQPLVRFRLEVRGRLGLRKSGAPPVPAQTFGDVVAELVGDQNIGHLYKPRNLPLSISQWRNVANHNSYDASGREVVCHYGPKEKEKSITLSLDELEQVMLECNAIYYAHKIAYEFFGVDNMESLLKRKPVVSASDYSIETNLAYGLVSEGFSIIRAGLAGRKWTLDLADTKSRTKDKARASIKLACHQYLVFAGAAEFSITIRAEGSEYSVGFVGAVSTSGRGPKGK